MKSLLVAALLLLAHQAQAQVMIMTNTNGVSVRIVKPVDKRISNATNTWVFRTMGTNYYTNVVHKEFWAVVKMYHDVGFRSVDKHQEPFSEYPYMDAEERIRYHRKNPYRGIGGLR